jgi:hypothetical protein
VWQIAHRTIKILLRLALMLLMHEKHRHQDDADKRGESSRSPAAGTAPQTQARTTPTSLASTSIAALPAPTRQT